MKQIAESNFSSTYLVYNIKQSKDYICKKYILDKVSSQVLNEWRKLVLNNNKHVVETKAFFWDDEKRELVFVFEKLYSSLDEVKLVEESALIVMAHVCQALLHNHK